MRLRVQLHEISYRYCQYFLLHQEECKALSLNIFELVSSYPLISVNENFVNYLNPKVSLRINPSDMKGYKDENRRINNDNIFNINRLGLIDTLESGENLTLGLEYKKEKINDINKYFEFIS